jgi:hypothetical protein
MAIVNIIIKGIAMSYYKDNDIWRIIFPFGECHEAKFKVDAGDPGIPLAEAGRRITVTTENPSSSFEIDDNYYDFLDLTADYSHADGVKLKDDWDEYAVFMTAENAKLSVYEYTPSEHVLTSSDNKVKFAPAQIGYSAIVRIESEKVIIDVGEHPDFPKIFDQNCTLFIDNDCEQGAERKFSDFDLVYNVVEDASPASERFVVRKISESLDTPIFVGSVYDPDDDNEGTKDPFARGLPCHKVRISKSENLP